MTPIIVVSALYGKDIKHFIAPGNKIMITITNKSGENITKIKIKHKENILEEEGIKKNKELIYYLDNTGESTYSIEATLKSGKIVNSSGVYAESGYAMSETVYKDSISTRYRF